MNLFEGIENIGRRHRASRWVTWSNSFLMSTMGVIGRVDHSVGFEIGCLEGASALRCGRCFLPGILVTG